MASLPKPGSFDYLETEAEDAGRAMVEMAVIMSRLGHRDAAKTIGQEDMMTAFRAGLDTYFALREARLRP